jgi:hypothetical protein
MIICSIRKERYDEVKFCIALHLLILSEFVICDLHIWLNVT